MIGVAGGVLLAIGVLIFVLEPVISGRSARLYRGSNGHDEAAYRRRVALVALRDLEYDRATGKLDASDYSQLKAELSHEALHHLNAAEEGAGAGEPSDAAAAQAHLGSAEIEAEIAQFRRALEEGGQCDRCGHLNRAGVRFCGSCGNQLGAAPGESVAEDSS